MNKKIKKLLSINKSLFKDIARFNKNIIILCINKIVFSTAYPLVLSIVPKIIIDSIENQIGILNLVRRILIISIAIAGISWINPFFHEKIAIKSEELRINYQLQLMAKLLNSNYELLTNRPKYEKAKIFIEGNGEAPCFEYLFTVCDLAISAIGLISCSIILSNKNIVLLLVFITCIVVEYFFNNKRYSNIRKMNEIIFSPNMKLDYIFRKALTTNFVRDAIIFNTSAIIKYKSILYSTKIASALNKYNTINSKLELKKLFFIVLRDFIICIIVLKNILDGTQNISDFVLYFGLINVMTKWINTYYISKSDLSYISSSFNNYKEFCETIKINTALDSKHNIKDFKNVKKIEFKNINYKYGTTEALKKINLTLQMGQKIAIIGKNGSGKSTLANIICGLFKPLSGTVFIDDMEVSFDEYSEFINQSISVVFQKDSLLPEKLHSNISLKETCNINSLIDSLNKTNMLKKTMSLHNTFNTDLIPSVHYDAPDFSGGEIQRLLMSRCFYKKTKINLFDEPTASLDVKSENLVYKSIMQEKTLSILISHRIANIMNADLIVVINEGEIAELGNHSELIMKKGIYYEMYNIQQNLFKL